ncbi:hypothetical protein BH23BAC4_BH23BAC4_13630 [soil metagenome]
MTALYDINRFALLEESHEWRARRNTGKMLPETLSGLKVLTSEDGRVPVRLGFSPTRHCHGRTCIGGSTSANGIKNHQRSSLFGRAEKGVNLIGRSQFFHAKAGQFFAHGLDKWFRVWHSSAMTVFAEGALGVDFVATPGVTPVKDRASERVPSKCAL